MQQIDHRVIKLLVGLIAVFLAFFMQSISGELLRSISESYHYRGRDWFVGLLFAVAALFVSFSGENTFERILTLIASALAATVAIAPCVCDRPAGALSALHYPAAAGLFAILGYFCWRFRRTAKSKTAWYPEAKYRVWVYSVCFAGMLGCGLMAAAYALAHEAMDARYPNYVFWMEALGLVSFGFSWLAASRTVPIITNPKERYRFGSGGAIEDDNFPTSQEGPHRMTANFTQLPKDLPAPVDDGAAAHLEGTLLPDVALDSTDGTRVNLAHLSGRRVIYIYPMTGRPDVPLPENWDAIPGARGCTPQSCSFRDHYAELQALNTGVYGLSVQTSDYQREARDRLRLPFEMLSDSALQLKKTLRLPTFPVAGMELYKRLTLIARDGRIEKCFYPVFPSDRNAADVLAWLRQNP